LQHGTVKDVRIVTYRNGTPKGLAYVEYENEVRVTFFYLLPFPSGWTTSSAEAVHQVRPNAQPRGKSHKQHIRISCHYGVTTSLENLEYSGFLWTWKTPGNSVQPQGKFLTKKIVSVRSNICVTQKAAVSGPSV